MLGLALQSHKMGSHFRVLRDRRITVSMQACRFLVAGAAFGNAAFCICMAGAAFCDVSKVLLP